MSQPSILDSLLWADHNDTGGITNNRTNEMTTTRQKLRPWLEGQLNRREIDGVEWLNEKERLFKIPWKHGGKSDWNPEDGELFKAWAKNTGKFREGQDKVEYAKWKTRVRCALHKANDILEVKDLHKTEEPKPYRVYKFLPLKDTRRSEVPSIGLTDEEVHQFSHLDDDDDSSQLPPGVPVVIQDFTCSGLQQQAQGENYINDTDYMGQDRSQLYGQDTNDAPMDEDGRLPSDLLTCESGDLIRMSMDLANLPDFSDQLSLNYGSLASDIVQYMDMDETVEQPKPLPAYEELELDPNSFPVDPNTGEPRVNLQSADGSTSQSQGGTPEQRPYLVQCKVTDGQGNISFPQCMSDQVHNLKMIFKPPVTLEIMDMPPNATIQDLAERQHQHDVKVKVEMDHQYQIPDEIIPPLLDLNTYNCQGYEMRVTLMYFGITLVEIDLFDCQGYRFYYGHDSDIRDVIPNKELADHIMGPEEMQPYHFPPIPDWCTDLQKQNIATVLEGLGKGFTVRCTEGNIYITRYCKTRVFVSSWEEHEVKDSLPRRMVQEKYNYQKYINKLSLESFTKPDPALHIGLAQKWNYGRPNNQVAISMRIVCCKALQIYNKVIRFDDKVYVSHDSPSVVKQENSKSDSMDKYFDQAKAYARGQHSQQK